MSVMAIIPARGGSRGIPRKNLLQLCGKPLVVYSIEQALACPLVDEVVVSTDDAKIGEVAKAAGAAVCWRPAELARDDSPTEDAIRHVLATHGSDPSVVVLLQPTSPIRQPGDIEATIETVIDTYFDSCFSVREVEGFVHVEGDTWAHWVRPMRQHKPKVLEENGSIYCFKRNTFLKVDNRICGEFLHYVMHPLDSFQLDEPWQIELFAKLIPLRMPQNAKLVAHKPSSTNYMIARGNALVPDNV